LLFDGVHKDRLPLVSLVPTYQDTEYSFVAAEPVDYVMLIVVATTAVVAAALLLLMSADMESS
jgi:hypothetical protein